jgi:hypothetical protein
VNVFCTFKKKVNKSVWLVLICWCNKPVKTFVWLPVWTDTETKCHHKMYCMHTARMAVDFFRVKGIILKLRTIYAQITCKRISEPWFPLHDYWREDRWLEVVVLVGRPGHLVWSNRTELIASLVISIVWSSKMEIGQLVSKLGTEQVRSRLVRFSHSHDRINRTKQNNY